VIVTQVLVSCVATPVAPLFQVQIRRLFATNANHRAVPKPKLSAPRIAALITIQAGL